MNIEECTKDVRVKITHIRETYAFNLDECVKVKEVQ